jgi:hypothetical protein
LQSLLLLVDSLTFRSYRIVKMAANNRAIQSGVGATVGAAAGSKKIRQATYANTTHLLRLCFFLFFAQLLSSFFVFQWKSYCKQSKRSRCTEKDCRIFEERLETIELLNTSTKVEFNFALQLQR